MTTKRQRQRFARQLDAALAASAARTANAEDVYRNMTEALRRSASGPPRLGLWLTHAEVSDLAGIVPEVGDEAIADPDADGGVVGGFVACARCPGSEECGVEALGALSRAFGPVRYRIAWFDAAAMRSTLLAASAGAGTADYVDLVETATRMGSLHREREALRPAASPSGGETPGDATRRA